MAYSMLELKSSIGVTSITKSASSISIAVSTLDPNFSIGVWSDTESEVSFSIAVSSAVARFAEHAYPYF